MLAAYLESLMFHYLLSHSHYSLQLDLIWKSRFNACPIAVERNFILCKWYNLLWMSIALLLSVWKLVKTRFFQPNVLCVCHIHKCASGFSMKSEKKYCIMFQKKDHKFIKYSFWAQIKYSVWLINAVQMLVLFKYWSFCANRITANSKQCSSNFEWF